MSRVGWLDASSGVSGDMLLGALADLGALDGLPALLDSLADLGVDVTTERVSQHGLAATACRVSARDDQPHRGLSDVTAIVGRAAVPDAVRAAAIRVFDHLAAVEAGIHSTTVDAVHFHEVGAVDAIVDVLGGCLGLHTLGLDSLTVSIALGGGMTRSAHGVLPVPAPAVLGLLRDTTLTSHGGPYDVELATPTGVALLAEWVTASGPMPAMTVESIGVGAGSRQFEDRANVVRIVVGETAEPSHADEPWLTIEANVDDLDPRPWPGVLDRLLAAGAGDAWLTPILMKKGRPAHTVTALVAASSLDVVRGVLLRETSTIGVRMTAVTKHALDRSWITVEVSGQTVRVKLAHEDGVRRNLSPEFDDVAAAAGALGLPVKDVLAKATAAALAVLDDPPA